MTIETIKLMLDALENHTAIKHPQQAYYRDRAIEAGKTAIAEAEKQEPVAVIRQYANRSRSISWSDRAISGFPDGTLLYTHSQPKREWVGLTHEEIDYQAKKDNHGVYFALGALWAEAKLNEKNT
jgi:hypothetical protein